MQEEVTRKTIALAIKTAKLDGKVLQAALRKLLQLYRKARDTPHCGKQTLKQLMRHGTGVSNIEITDANIKAFESTAKKYGMECMRKWEKIGCNILCGLALWEQMQDCDRRGVPYTDIDIEAVSQEVAYRLMMSHDRLYALALYEWTEQHFTQNSDTSDAAAGENGCDFPTHNNST